jgi:AcrR family transcriptional regulator
MMPRVSSTTAASKRPPGRPRRAATERAIADAARVVLARDGIARMSIEQVAIEAGVAKTTIYRRWASKVELAVDAVAATFDTIALEDNGSLLEDLRAGIGEAARLLSEPSIGGAYAALLAESARDPEGVGAKVRSTLAVQLHGIVGDCVERGIARGEIDAGSVDVDLLGDLVVGTVMHRALMTGEADPGFVEALIALLVDVAFFRQQRAQKRAGSR